jgi:hypothetical protein
MSGFSLTRTTVLTVVAGLEVAVILFFVARWYSRRWGFRSTLGRIRRYVRDTFLDLAAPAVRAYRFSRNVRQIAVQLTDPELDGVLRTVTGSSTARLAGEPDCWPYAVLLSRTAVTVALTGWRRVEAQTPWHNRDGWWITQRQNVTSGLAAEMNDVPVGHVVVGAENGTVTLLDLLRAPGVIEVTGPDRPVGSLICAVAAQLSSGLVAFEPMDVIVASGLHPRYAGPKPLTVLQNLDVRSRVATYDHPITMLFCGPLSPAEADLLTALMPRLPNLRVMMAGPYAGRRWRLSLTETGRVEAPELGLSTDSSAVERGVARSLKLRADQPQTQHPQTQSPQAQPFPTVPGAPRPVLAPASSAGPQYPAAAPAFFDSPDFPAPQGFPAPFAANGSEPAEVPPPATSHPIGFDTAASPTARPTFDGPGDAFASPETSSFFTQPSGPDERETSSHQPPSGPANSHPDKTYAPPPTTSRRAAKAARRDNSVATPDGSATRSEAPSAEAHPSAPSAADSSVAWAAPLSNAGHPTGSPTSQPLSQAPTPGPANAWAKPLDGTGHPATPSDPHDRGQSPTAPASSATPHSASDWAEPIGGTGRPTTSQPRGQATVTPPNWPEPLSSASRPTGPATSRNPTAPSPDASSGWAAPPRETGHQAGSPRPQNPTAQTDSAAQQNPSRNQNAPAAPPSAPRVERPASIPTWDLEEPESISPPTGSTSVSAIKARAARTDAADDSARR